MIIAIDGPAGSGKSSVAQAVARWLGMTYIDTGAMYRTVTLLALETGVSPAEGKVLGALALDLKLSFRLADDGTTSVFIGSRDVSREIRAPEVSRRVSQVAAHEEVRRALTLKQQRLAAAGDSVLEGRDIGTVVCPGADLKIYLTASVEERARRRRLQLAAQNICLAQEVLEREIAERDSYDAGRALAPLVKAPDAVEFDTTEMSVSEVVAKICSLAVKRRSLSGLLPEGSC